jgi:hypothetical protein
MTLSQICWLLTEGIFAEFLVHAQTVTGNVHAQAVTGNVHAQAAQFVHAHLWYEHKECLGCGIIPPHLWYKHYQSKLFALKQQHL